MGFAKLFATRSAFLGVLLAFGAPALAEGLDPATSEALGRTQDLLRNREQRQKAVQENSEAQKLDSRIQSMLGSQASVDAIYGMSSDVLATLVKETKGDPAALSRILADLQRNPAALRGYLRPEDLKRIRELSQDVRPSAPGAP